MIGETSTPPTGGTSERVGLRSGSSRTPPPTEAETPARRVPRHHDADDEQQSTHAEHGTEDVRDRSRRLGVEGIAATARRHEIGASRGAARAGSESAARRLARRAPREQPEG